LLICSIIALLYASSLFEINIKEPVINNVKPKRKDIIITITDINN